MGRVSLADTRMATPARVQKNFMTQAELAQAQALYIQGMMPLMISKVLNEQRDSDSSGLPAIVSQTIQRHAYNGKWFIERKEYTERQSETIATALEAIKEQAGSEMVVIVKSLHDSFIEDLNMIKAVRAGVKTARDALDLIKAQETLQKRLFHFHALQSKPLANAALPMKSVSSGDAVLSGGEEAELVA